MEPGRGASNREPSEVLAAGAEAEAGAGAGAAGAGAVCGSEAAREDVVVAAGGPRS